MHYSLRAPAGRRRPGPPPNSPRTLSDIFAEALMALPCVFVLRKFSGVAVDALMSRLGLGVTPLAVLYSAARPQCALARPPATLTSLATCWAPHVLPLAGQGALTRVLLCLWRDSAAAATPDLFLSWPAAVHWGIVLRRRRPHGATRTQGLRRHARMYAMYLAVMAAYYMLEIVAVAVWRGPEALARQAHAYGWHSTSTGWHVTGLQSTWDAMLFQQGMGRIMREVESLMPVFERMFNLILTQMHEEAGARGVFKADPMQSSQLPMPDFAFDVHVDSRDTYLSALPGPHRGHRLWDWRLYMPMVFLGGLLWSLYAWPSIAAWLRLKKWRTRA